MGTEVVETRRRIIRRPRLTKLLDESPARIKLLIAPAGYGKTTLAQEWLSEPSRQDVWYRGGPAAADVAALAAGLSVAASEVVPDAGKRMRERLRATGHPEEDVEILAELFAEDLQSWPETAWLAIDDYHFAMDSTASERFVDLLTQQTPLQLVVTSRRRPTWATARRILYGEIYEVDRRLLALDDHEAARVLNRDADSVVDLLARARGWPAVIGLAALTEGVQPPSTGVPDALYRYFAEEILQSADAETRAGLTRLALAEVVDEELAQAVLGGGYMRTLREGSRLGVLVQERQTYLVHPLLRDFLQMQLQLLPEVDAETSPHAFVAECLLAQKRWDEAFDLAERFKDLPLAEQVLSEALDPLLEDGRIATIGRWLDRGDIPQSDSAVFDFGEAEVAFRYGEHGKAEALAAGAALRLPEGHPLASRAFARAGRSAHIASRERESLEYFAEARKRAHTPRDVREALVGLYFAASDLGLSEAATFLAELSNLDDGSPETALRAGVARLIEATRKGAIERAVSRELGSRYLARKTSDPLAATAFLHMLANGLNLIGRYSEAREVIEEVLEIARAYRLEMPVPHALLNLALAQHGRRDFRHAHASLDRIDAFLPPGGDVYLEFTRRAIRARLFMSEGRLDEASAAVGRPSTGIPSPALRSEYLGSQALVWACMGDKRRPRELVREAIESFDGSVEARVLGACAIAVVEGEGAAFEAATRTAWQVATQTGNLDGIVCGYRGYPPILQQLLSEQAAKPVLVELVTQARDERLASQLGTRIAASEARAKELLTPREREVLELLREGLSNRAIATALFVSEATVKVHLRHIYEKLGVRSRAEALAQALGSSYSKR